MNPNHHPLHPRQPRNPWSPPGYRLSPIRCQLPALALFALFCGSTFSQSVPPLINYQGRLTDASGAPLSGTHKLEFNIYTNAISGTNIWGPQTFNMVPVINGAFNVILGHRTTRWYSS
jgi:hypothetical protein